MVSTVLCPAILSSASAILSKATRVRSLCSTAVRDASLRLSCSSFDVMKPSNASAILSAAVAALSLWMSVSRSHWLALSLPDVIPGIPGVTHRRPSSISDWMTL